MLRYLKVLLDIGGLIFKYYPKRRKRFITRFCGMSIVKKMKNKTFPIKYNFLSDLYLEGLVAGNGEYTKLGFRVISVVVDLFKEKAK
ncbi:MAG: hypothetical protein ACTSUV_00300 [Candidatus Ranarchaeia archaeon]